MSVVPVSVAISASQEVAKEHYNAEGEKKVTEHLEIDAAGYD